MIVKSKNFVYYLSLGLFISVHAVSILTGSFYCQATKVLTKCNAVSGRFLKNLTFRKSVFSVAILQGKYGLFIISENQHFSFNCLNTELSSFRCQVFRDIVVLYSKQWRIKAQGMSQTPAHFPQLKAYNSKRC